MIPEFRIEPQRVPEDRLLRQENHLPLLHGLCGFTRREAFRINTVGVHSRRDPLQPEHNLMPGVRIAAIFPEPLHRHIQHTDRIAVPAGNTVDPVSCRTAGIHKFLHGLFRIGLAFLPRVRANIQQVIRILQRPVFKERLQGCLPLRLLFNVPARFRFLFPGSRLLSSQQDIRQRDLDFPGILHNFRNFVNPGFQSDFVRFVRLDTEYKLTHIPIPVADRTPHRPFRGNFLLRLFSIQRCDANHHRRDRSGADCDPFLLPVLDLHMQLVIDPADPGQIKVFFQAHIQRIGIIQDFGRAVYYGVIRHLHALRCFAIFLQVRKQVKFYLLVSAHIFNPERIEIILRISITVEFRIIHACDFMFCLVIVQVAAVSASRPGAVKAIIRGRKPGDPVPFQILEGVNNPRFVSFFQGGNHFHPDPLLLHAEVHWLQFPGNPREIRFKHFKRVRGQSFHPGARFLSLAFRQGRHQGRGGFPRPDGIRPDNQIPGGGRHKAQHQRRRQGNDRLPVPGFFLYRGLFLLLHKGDDLPVHSFRKAFRRHGTVRLKRFFNIILQHLSSPPFPGSP